MAEFSLHTDEEIMRRMENRRSLFVCASGIPLSECDGWGYDARTGSIRTPAGNFFRIVGATGVLCSGESFAQPLLIQDETGILGLLARKIRGVWHFLVQAKIEPGNENIVQLSPTAQATYSNYTRSHGGAAPPFAEFFLEKRGRVAADTVQYEQCSRYLAKRNRNMILLTEEDVPESYSHFYVTLAQLARFMPTGAVNLDVRLLLSLFPFSPKADCSGLEKRLSGYISAHPFRRELCGLEKLADWGFDGSGFSCRRTAPFGIVFRRVRIDGREVPCWCQPLMAGGGGLYGCYVRQNGDEPEFLCRVVSEPGCRDGALIGPAVFTEPGGAGDEFSACFENALSRGDGVLFNAELPEDGGRSWHEKNRYALIMHAGEPIPDDAFWAGAGEIAGAIAETDVCSMQLRSLYALYYLASDITPVDF
ncbi:MAG: NDP-hexose 2,3-dehydratase family protein [Clostridia bacterium]|nr:NDP-hexose 2,3-dehydratase family protein [Clostridia bacterium]